MDEKKKKEIVYKAIGITLKNQPIDNDVGTAIHFKYIYYNKDNGIFAFKVTPFHHQLLAISLTFLDSIQKIVPIEIDEIKRICIEWYDENVEYVKTHDKVDWL